MQYEIEIKSLLGSKEAANTLLGKVKKRDPQMKLVSEQQQLNHYFKDGDLSNLTKSLSKYLTADQVAQIERIKKHARHLNVRTREKNKKDVIVVVKGALDEGSAAHSHHRMEFESIIPLKIAELDELIIDSGWKLEAKWQADRKIYEALGLTLDMVFAPGYGYFVEFEKVVQQDTDRDAAHDQLVKQMQDLGVEELPVERLERMFAYYNDHWQDYYGTDKIFVIE